MKILARWGDPDYDYFGKAEYEQYGDMISEELSGKRISKAVALAHDPGGLVYEAERLGLDTFELLRALEGMCYNGTAREVDDSTYLVF